MGFTFRFSSLESSFLEDIVSVENWVLECRKLTKLGHYMHRTDEHGLWTIGVRHDENPKPFSVLSTIFAFPNAQIAEILQDKIQLTINILGIRCSGTHSFAGRTSS